MVEVGLANDDPEDALFATCDPRTRPLSISAVQYTNGLRPDLEYIGMGCRRHDVLFCIGTIQQLDALSSDIQAYDCVFTIADGHRWMLDLEGLGILYCHPGQRKRLVLHEYGWHALEHALDYERCDWRPARNTRRFECGNPNMPDAMAPEASLRLLEEVNMERVGRDIIERAQWLQDGLSGIPGICLYSP